MPRGDDQIRRDYAAQSVPARFGQSVDDLVRIIASGATGGFVDDLAGGDSAERTRQARVRSGTIGDVAKTGGMLVGLKGAGGVVKSAYGAVRAAPTAARLVPTAGLGTAARYLTGTAGPGLVPVAARSMPTLGTLAKVAGAAGLFGLAASERADPTVATVAAAPKAAPVAKAAAQPRAAARVPTPYDRQLAAIDTILASPNMTLSDLQSATGMLPARAKPPTAKDQQFNMAGQLSQAIFQNQIKDAELLSKTDPEGARALTAKAMEAEFQRRAGLVGVNPMNMQLAEQIAAAGEVE